jgi:ELWxxDGT repeat protein
MTMFRAVTILGLLTLVAAPAAAQAPYLVKDINTVENRTRSLVPEGLKAGTGVLYFSGHDAAADRVLWRTDGTPDGTRLVYAGPASMLATIGTVAFFLGSDPTTGSELWRSDGTPAGTAPVREIHPGPAPVQISEAVASGGLLYFVAFDGMSWALWRSDGTSDGTVRLLESHTIRKLTGTDGPLYFSRSEGATGWELWRSDGTVAGTTIVRDVCPGDCSSNPEHLVVANGRLFFDADDGASGREVWVTDGTTTSLATDLAAPGQNPQIAWSAALGDGLAFATTAAPARLWITDGTSGGTEPLATVAAAHLASGGGAVFFVGDAPATGREVWRTDGTVAGTGIVRDLCPGSCHFFESASLSPRFVGTPSGVYFIRDDSGPDTLWHSDGTAAGTLQIAGDLYGTVPAAMGDALFFAAGSYIVSGIELFVTDGTPGGVRQLTEAVDSASNPALLTVAEDRLFFSAVRLGNEGRDLWVTEGTAATTLPTPVHPGVGDVYIGAQVALGRDLLFGTQTGLWHSGGSPPAARYVGQLYMGAGATIGSEALLYAAAPVDGGLWRSDGTPEGTREVARLVNGNPSVGAGYLGALGDTRLFTLFDTTRALWRTDGTPEGTARVATLGATHAAPLGDELVLLEPGGSAEPGRLWRTDGTTQGTQPIALPAGVLIPNSPTAANGLVFFAAWTNAAGLELWSTDGTAAGTALVKDVRPGPESAIAYGSYQYSPFVVLDRSIYFFADDGVHGRELWRSDGTEAGTVMVGETIAGPQTAVPPGIEDIPDALVATGGLLFFAGRTIAEGLELWRSDGQTAPVLRADVAAGPASSRPAQFRTDGGRLYFAADGAAGRELWALELLPSLTVADVTVPEGDGAPGIARFTVRLAPPSAATAVVAYATADGSATAGVDYTPRSGTLTFAPGATTATVDVPVLPDLSDEGDEAFVLRLSAPQVASITDGEATALLRDDDAPRVTVAGASVTEGNAGTTPAPFDVTFVTKDGNAAVLPHTVTWHAGSDTATVGVDFAAAEGTLSFHPGTPNGAHVTVNVPVIGDTLDEPHERFTLQLASASAILTPTAPAYGIVLDDDGAPSGFPLELGHGTRLSRDLAASAGSDWYRLSQAPHSSYEVVVDEVSGDALPLLLERVAADGATVLQTAVAGGTGASVGLVWQNSTNATVAGERIRVTAGGCGSGCGADDTYRLRVYETTLRGSRFNNVGSQRTALVLHNTSGRVVHAHVVCWLASGVPSIAFPLTLEPRETRVFDTALATVGSGSVTVAHDAGYGGLSGKLVTADPAVGFAFDTPLTPAPR